ncbi:MAG: methyltransferase domain-containing protein [Geminicoccaceae bacterium]|nr:MAG: methyltransferase domain-containing protein [Geminicoccaceae bacterium]
MTPEDFQFLAQLLRQQSGLALGPDKGYLLESRLAPIARRLDLGDVARLVRRLRERPDAALIAAVVDAMTTNESFFFRDARPFEQFSDVMLPALMQARRNSKRLSIWCAAAATGQEPYSLAMCLEDRARELQGWQVSILATDISPTALERAKQGRYTQFEVQRGLPVKRLLQHFTQQGDQWVVKPELKRWIRFQSMNLLEIRPNFATFDIIFCRNVLIYFDVGGKRRTIEVLASCLAPDGYFVLGGTETLLGLSNRFEAMAEQRGLYRLVSSAQLLTA